MPPGEGSGTRNGTPTLRPGSQGTDFPIAYTRRVPDAFSLCWRVLLVAALVLNPVAGALASVAEHAAPAPVAAAQGDLPPCHHAMAGRLADTATTSTRADLQHGCDCGNTACQFGGCCSVGALALPAPRFQPIAWAHGQAIPAREIVGTAAPPPSRLIRPPIA